MSVTAIIVNFNAGDLLQQCVNALRKSTVFSSITIIDNASSDGSAQQLRNMYGDRQGIKFLFNPSNLGFAPAVNSVASRVDSEWILILNPDCILAPTALQYLQAAIADDSNAALAGPAVQDERGQIQKATLRRFPSPWKSLMTASGLWRLGRWFSSFHGIEVAVGNRGPEPVIAEAVSGACMLVRRSALEAVGYLDEDYLMHCEDLDLMYRLAQEGWHCLFVPRAVCVHHQGTSSRSRPGWVHYQKHRGMLRFFKKFQADTYSAPVRLLVRTGIWLRFISLWPLVLIKR